MVDYGKKVGKEKFHFDGEFKRVGKEKYKVASGKKAAPGIERAAKHIGREKYKAGFGSKSKIMRL